MVKIHYFDGHPSIWCLFNFTGMFNHNHDIIYIITPHACTRDKVTGSVIIRCCQHPHKNCQISTSRHLSRWPVVKSGEKLMNFCFKTLDKGHKRYKSFFLFGHAYWLHLGLVCHVLFPLCMLKLIIHVGKGHQVIKAQVKWSVWNLFQNYCTTMVKVMQCAWDMCSSSVCLHLLCSYFLNNRCQESRN